MKINDIMRHIEQLAPLGLASSWDNVGLMLGGRDWEISKVYVTLDVTPTAVEEAIRHNCQLILSHHPLIFRPLKSVSDPLHLKLIQHNIAVISLHTNLDTAKQSVNHALADKLGLQVTGTLSNETGAKYHHLVVQVPASHADAVSQAVWNAGGGNNGNYTSCATRYPVKGYFTAAEGAKPYLNKPEGEPVNEVTLQFMCDSFCLNGVLQAINKAHPYETPALHHYPVDNTNPAYGLGLVCSSSQPLTLLQLGELVKARLGCLQLRLWSAGQNEDAPLNRIAICGGSGGSLLGLAASKAEVFITGDINYHTYLDSRIPLIDAGHFYTEYPALNLLADMVNQLELTPIIMPAEKHEFNRFFSAL